MAEPLDVKSYLACWFQLGKAVIVSKPEGTRRIQPQRVLTLDGLSEAFEACWQGIVAEPDHCYLEDTDETIADLLSDRWQLDPCSRCGLPVPLPLFASPASGPCPCAALDHWPNDQTIPPRMPTESSPMERFDQIRQRLSSC